MAAIGLRIPDPFSFDGDVASQWPTWRKKFEWYLKGTKQDKESEELQIGILITLLGADGLSIYETFNFNDAATSKKIKPVLEKFDEHFQHQKVKHTKGTSF